MTQRYLNLTDEKLLTAMARLKDAIPAPSPAPTDGDQAGVSLSLHTPASDEPDPGSGRTENLRVFQGR